MNQEFKKLEKRSHRRRGDNQRLLNKKDMQNLRQRQKKESMG